MIRRTLRLASLGILVAASASARAEGTRPNVLIVITDDQGYGDLGVHGNPVDQDAEPRPAGARGRTARAVSTSRPSAHRRAPAC